MDDWLPDLTSARGSKYLAIAEAMGRDIQSGRLRTGARLPPQRALAEALGVDLTTVTRAYGEAQRRGLIEGDGRRGSFVRAREPDHAATAIGMPVETGMNAPPVPAGEVLAEAWREACNRFLASDSGALPCHYQPSGGMPSARAAGAALLAGRGIACSADSVVVTAGGQHGLHAVVSTALQPGDAVAVAEHVYPGFLALARRYGLVMVPLASDQEGLLPDALAEACRNRPIRALYVVPTNDNPTTATMGPARREAIAAIAASANLLVIEDDAYGLLPEVAPVPLAALAPERTYHICSTSKIISPGLRVAWVRAPSIGAAWRLAADLHETAIMAPPMNTAAVTLWLETGAFARLSAEVRRESRARQAIVAALLRPGSYRANADGYHLWLPLEAGTDAGMIAEALRPHGLSILPARAFSARGEAASPALRVSTGGLIGREQLHSAIHLLAELTGPGGSRKVSLV